MADYVYIIVTIQNQDIWCGVYYHFATKMLLMLQASGCL
jgi:hypothetical protein